MAASVNKMSLKNSKFLSKKLWIAVAVFLIVAIFFLVSYRIYHSQPAKIVINPNNLNAAEYQTLNKVMENKETGSFFTAILPHLKDTVMEQGWVSQVDIERKWGKGIVITALPREPVAKFGSEYLVDSQGVAFKPLDEGELNQANLIMLQGNAEQSSLIMQQMQQVNQWFSALGMQVEDMVLTPRMTWIIRFDDGLRVIVDNEHTSQKLMNLSQVLQNQLADKREDIASVDLRYKNGFVIDWKNGSKYSNKSNAQTAITTNITTNPSESNDQINETETEMETEISSD